MDVMYSISFDTRSEAVLFERKLKGFKNPKKSEIGSTSNQGIVRMPDCVFGGFPDSRRYLPPNFKTFREEVFLLFEDET